MRTRKDRAKSIILAYSVAHATIAAILANTVIGDVVALTPLTILMVYQLSKLCDQDLTSAAIAALAAQLFGAVSGGYLASKLVSWIPIWGNGINATVTFGITQVIGWAAFAMFDKGLTKEEAIKYGKSQKITKEEMEAIEASMSEPDKERYSFLKKEFSKLNLSDIARQNIASEMANLMDKYKI